jgi:hypothetical protein
MRKRLFVTMGFLLMVGCIPMSTHNGANLAKVDEFKIEKGKTTEREVFEEFGEPGSRVTQGDGSRVLTWTDARSKSNMPLLPIVPYTNQTTTTSRSLSVTIRDGVVIDYMITGGTQKF